MALGLERSATAGPRACATRAAVRSRQRLGLSEAGCDQITQEVQSGVRARNRLDVLVASLRPGDELIVTELDRLGRSTGEAIVLMDEPIRRGVRLRVLALPSLDIATNDGRLIADILASLAAHERRRTRERQRQGIQAARAAGRHLGRPPKMNGQQIAEARGRLAAGEPTRVVAAGRFTARGCREASRHLRRRRGPDRVFRIDADAVGKGPRVVCLGVEHATSRPSGSCIAAAAANWQ